MLNARRRYTADRAKVPYHRRRQPHRDDVGGDELARSDAGVKPVGRKVDQFLACRDLELDLGIGLAEGLRLAAPAELPRVPRPLYGIAMLATLRNASRPVERPLPDCEALLHSPSILSRIVARG